ncbi:MAG: hypothetical protein ACK583_09615 [Cyanobacteriota bacterium]
MRQPSEFAALCSPAAASVPLQPLQLILSVLGNQVMQRLLSSGAPAPLTPQMARATTPPVSGETLQRERSGPGVARERQRLPRANRCDSADGGRTAGCDGS